MRFLFFLFSGLKTQKEKNNEKNGDDFFFEMFETKWL